MKRVGFYRRTGKEGPHHGIKERVVWQLSKRPMTPTELAEILGVERWRILDNLTAMLKDEGVAQVVKGEEVARGTKKPEHLYHFKGLGSRIFPKCGKSILVSSKSAANATSETRIANIEKAKRRARLIAAGLYVDEMG